MDNSNFSFRLASGPSISSDMSSSTNTVTLANVPYRVVGTTPNTSNSTLSNSPSKAEAPTVLTNSLNGQFYVIGNPAEVLSTNRAIAPRLVLTQSAATPDIPATRTDRRRATHNEVERRRRDNINTWIMKLGRLIPSEQESGPPKNTSLSKGGILARACDYILELKANSMKQCTKDVELENERLKRQVDELKQENLMLREQLGLRSKNQPRNQIFM